MQVEVTREVKEPLRRLDRHYRGRICTVAANAYEVETPVLDAYLVIGAVLVRGERVPRLVSDVRVAAGQRARRTRTGVGTCRCR